MLHSYLKVALRHLIRDRGHALLNILGLSVGIAACLVIGLYVTHELSYDQQYPEVNRIYRVVMDWHFRETGVVRRYATVSPVLARKVQDDTPAILSVTRLLPLGRSTTFRTDDRVLSENRAVLCDPDLPNVFGIPFLKGDPESALSSVSSAVMTVSAAKRYFGEEEPIGQTIHALDLSFQVSGIIPDLPYNSHLKFEILLPVDAVPWFKNWDVWGNMAGFTYVRLGPTADFTRVDERIRTVTDRLAADEHDRVGVTYRHRLQPITDIHLRSNLLYDTPGNGKIEFVLLFAGIGVLILLIACINFVNLTVARFARRIREVGLRKVVGARRVQLFGQFLGESLLLVGVSVLAGVGLAELGLPYAHHLIGDVQGVGKRPLVVVVLCAATGLAGLLAGVFPAYRVSKHVPVDVLKGETSLEGRPSRLGRALIVFQLTASAVLIVSSSVIFSQIEFMQSADLGFVKDQVLCLNLGQSSNASDVSSLKSELLRRADVEAVTATRSVPGRMMEDTKIPVQTPSGEVTVTFQSIRTDHDYLAVLGIPLLAGRYFTPDETRQSYVNVINEATASLMGYTTPGEAIGKRIGKSEVVGVIPDYHHKSLHHRVEPLLIGAMGDFRVYVAIKLNTSDVRQSVEDIQEVWRSAMPDMAFDYFFLDDDFDRQYRVEDKFGRLSSAFSSLAAFIAGIGLFGLASDAAQRRMKEVSIRKVLGASVAQVWSLLSSDFFRLILISIAISGPLATYGLTRWLSTFPVRTSVDGFDFLLAFGALGAVGLVTISYHVTRAALSDPSEVLRKE